VEVFGKNEAAKYIHKRMRWTLLSAAMENVAYFLVSLCLTSPLSFALYLFVSFTLLSPHIVKL